MSTEPEELSTRPPQEPTVRLEKGPVHDPLTFDVIGACMKVHRTLGMGFTEDVYQRALQMELMRRQIGFASQREYEVFYEGMFCGKYRVDMVIEDRIILELKAVEDLARPHYMQTISYLRASGLSTGLLVNFGSTSLQTRRFENRSIRKHASPNPGNPQNPLPPAANASDLARPSRLPEL